MENNSIWCHTKKKKLKDNLKIIKNNSIWFLRRLPSIKKKWNNFPKNITKHKKIDNLSTKHNEICIIILNFSKGEIEILIWWHWSLYPRIFECFCNRIRIPSNYPIAYSHLLCFTYVTVVNLTTSPPQTIYTAPLLFVSANSSWLKSNKAVYVLSHLAKMPTNPYILHSL